MIVNINIENENKSTLNVDGWEQGVTTKKLKEELNKFETDPFDINSFKFRKPTEIILKLLNIYNEEKFNFHYLQKRR